VPGGGGTQRLARFIGKSKAMEMCITGRLMDAVEAERCGLVSRIVPAGELVRDALKTGAQIARLSRPVVMMIKDCVNHAYDSLLTEGLRFERRMLQACFSLDDRREGMAAFSEKREPTFTHRVTLSHEWGDSDPMDIYHIWFNLKDGVRDTEFAQNVHAYLGHLKEQGSLVGYRITRRKLGLGPPQLPGGTSSSNSRTWRRWIGRSIESPHALTRLRAFITRSTLRSRTSSSHFTESFLTAAV
jgi:hypothetical protein